ncbi:unnamed protein product, partial [Pylaiella littoralis]
LLYACVPQKTAPPFRFHGVDALQSLCAPLAFQIPLPFGRGKKTYVSNTKVRRKGAGAAFHCCCCRVIAVSLKAFQQKLPRSTQDAAVRDSRDNGRRSSPVRTGARGCELT